MERNVGIGTVVILAIMVSLFSSCAPRNDSEIQLAARRSSVQVQMYTPAIKVSYTTPLKTEAEFNRKALEKAIETAQEELKEYLDSKIESELEDASKPRHESSLTRVEDYAYEPKSKTSIPIGALKDVPDWAKYPERVLVAWKTEKKDIKPWQKEGEEDVLAISEVAGVSISQAKLMLSKIQAEGYTVSKESVDEASEVTLLWFSSGWDSSYPATLDWEVTVGDSANMITGYRNGVIETKPLPDDENVYVKAGYFDLRDEFKPKSSDIINLEREIESLEIEKKELEKKIEDLEPEEEPYKRDIRGVTFADVLYGNVKVEVLWFVGGGSGVYLGNAEVSEEMGSWQAYGSRVINNKEAGFILTNAHVAAGGLQREVWVSDDDEVMYIVGPGEPSIRYTQHSDGFGSPANVLFMDGTLVYSVDYDCALYLTTPIHGYEKNAAKLGDSDKVKDGTKVVMVGNPSSFQKFSTTGIISNTGFPPVKAGIFKGMRSLLPMQFIDAPIGAGGTSGSAVIALEGSQAGKVVGLHNSGIMSGVWVTEIKDHSDLIEGTSSDIDIYGPLNGKLKNISEEQTKELFKDFPYRDAEFNKPFVEIKQEGKEENFITMMEDKAYVVVRMHGMSAGIPINHIKAYLQERGIDPEVFGFESVGRDYWVK